MPRLLQLTILSAAALLLAAQEPPLRGYSAEAARLQRQWEARFRDIPSTENLRAYVERLSARPHHVGSPYGKQNAEWMLAKFKEWGWHAHIETFQVLFPAPKERLVELLEPSRYLARLQEPPVPEDPTSDQQDEQLPTYNAYSADGDVTAPLVYVNYGVPEDYDQLERLGVSVKGAIVIARYGASWRGIKPKVAAERGALGCLIYSDPREDGFFQGEVFPQGPYRPPHGVQRGSVLDMPLYPGDPLTPGVGATAGAKRLPLSEARTIARIPTLPLSWADARPLLATLRGPVAPLAWRGALPLTYRLGPGPAKVRLRVKSSWDLKPAYDVIARLRGADRPDEWIIRGNHHDAWVNGADDPSTGLAALLEEARAFGELLKQGWRPRRTLVYCAWDAEEPALLGSTEWAETHAAELRRKAVAYINTDSTGRGFLRGEGSPTLEKLLSEVARDIPDPDTRFSVYERARLARIASASPQERQDIRKRAALRISAPGSGSDYTAFTAHLGIPSLNLAFGGLDGSGIYHSIYDDFYWYTRFADSDFRYVRTLAQTAGTAAMRLADAELLPLEFTALAESVRRWVRELETLFRDRRAEIQERNRQIQEGVFAALADSRRPSVTPSVEPLPPQLDFAPLTAASEALQRAAKRHERALVSCFSDASTMLPRGAGLQPAAPQAEPPAPRGSPWSREGQSRTLAGASPRSFEAVNGRLIGAERRLTDPVGLPGRPWFKHLVYAPGLYTGYSAKTLPLVREALEQKRWRDAEAGIARTGGILRNMAAFVEATAAEMEKGTR
ncbi:MAG: M28 family peptidase [Acidobacteria bacterium]|nr:M28 family peptidase [Acidobacteriota bacterium]